MLSKLRVNNQKGFTLIELMIVIAIIGILAAIAIPNFIAYRNKSYCSRAESDAQNVLAGIACYFAEPDHMTVPAIATLQADTICNVEMNEGQAGVFNQATIWDDSGAAGTWRLSDDTISADNTPMSVQVTDASGLCPRAEDGTLVYTVYLGTEIAGEWIAPH